MMATLLSTKCQQSLLMFEESNQWLRASWRGFLDPYEVMRGAEHYLAQTAPFPCPYLLNDNSNLRGAWFDSVEWLERAWLPRALELGLRYIAHVVPPLARMDMLTLHFPAPLVGSLELQVFQHVAEAEEWLRNCQRQERWRQARPAMHTVMAHSAGFYARPFASA